MRALDQKLLRDLTHLKGQVVTIALVVGSGIAAYVTLQGTYESLESSRRAYYERERFADVFVHLKRAPKTIARRLEDVKGVAAVYPRVVAQVTIPLDTIVEPAVGQIVSIPAAGEPPLNGVVLRSGRMVEPGHREEVVVLESFALAHGIQPGDRIPAVINGVLQQLRVVGIGMSPEYVFPTPVGGAFSDDSRFAVLWMHREEVASAFDLDGAFNDVAFRLQAAASKVAVVTEIDRVLQPFGGLGAVTRDDQISNYILKREMEELQSFGAIAAAIFLGVAAFLVNVVLSRFVLLQRTQIATLKASGYRNVTIGVHFLKLVSVVVLMGTAIGIALGSWLGREMVDLYGDYFRFPTLRYDLDVGVLLISFAVSAGTAGAGAALSMWRVMRMPPAEAMRPPPPASYRRGWLERVGIASFLNPSARIVARELGRRPLRTLLSVVGIAMAVAIMVLAWFRSDALDLLIRMQFHEAWREDVSVTFHEPARDRAARELAHLPGVLHAEGIETVPVRFHRGHRSRESTLVGYAQNQQLRRVLDRSFRARPIPEHGLMLTAKLAELLDVDVGDFVDVELRKGDRAMRKVQVSALVDEPLGLQGYMRLDEAWRLLRGHGFVSGALLRVDRGQLDEVHRRIKNMPTVASVLSKDTLVRQFHEQTGRVIAITTLIMVLLASTIAVAVVYNNARISLSMRGRDLASLRVLGFTRGEVSAILLGELAVHLLLAIPVGLVLGYLLCRAAMSAVDPEQYRFPVVVYGKTYLYASLVTLGSGVLSAMLVGRRIRGLDLVGVLKTRE